MVSKPLSAFVFLLVVLVVSAGSVTAGLPADVGIEVTVEPSLRAVGSAAVDILWAEKAEEAFLTLRASDGVEAIDGTGLVLTAGDRIAVGGVAAGQVTRLEVFGLDEGGSALLLAERANGAVSDQRAITLRVDGDGRVDFRTQDYRVRPVRAGEGAAAAFESRRSSEEVTAEPGRGALVIDILQPKTAATVFGEDPSNHAIPDGPGNCADSGGSWPTFPFFSINSAPAGATSTAITVHVEVTHPLMADLQIAFGRADTPTYWQLNYLWKEDPGVNLDEDFTRDRYYNNFMALGHEVNGYYALGVRDCAAADTGTLTYWSVLIEYDDPAGVDLIADSITPQSASVQAGSSVDVNWFGHSSGASSGDVTTSFSAGLYLSPDANVTTGDTLLERPTVTPPISPGQSFGDTGVAVVIPGGTPAGTRYLGLIVDDTSAIAESDENNNTAVAAITVTTGGGGQPDLSPASCTVNPTTIEPGDSITVSWMERNVGTDDAGAFWTHVLRSTNTTHEPSDPQWGQRSTPSLAAGGTASKTLSTSVTGSLADGTYYVLVVSDINDEVTESNENNNLCYAALTVDSGGGPEPSDRWLIPAAASATGTGGSDWRTQISVTNPTNQNREANIYYVADNQSWPGLLLSGPINVGARQAQYIDDVLLTLRPTTGLMYVVLDDSGPVVTSRTYNLKANGSTFGQGIPGIPMAAGSSPDELVLPMVHSGGGRFHTNVGLVQTSGGSITLEISIYTAGGSLLASQQRTVSTAWDQINDIFDKFNIGSAVIEGGWIRVRLISGSPDSWMCYASIVDKETGDGTYIAGVEAE